MPFHRDAAAPENADSPYVQGFRSGLKSEPAPRLYPPDSDQNARLFKQGWDAGSDWGRSHLAPVDLDGGYRLTPVLDLEAAKVAGARSRSAVDPYFKWEAENGRGAKFFVLDGADGNVAAIVAVLPPGEEWKTGHQLNQRIHVTGMNNADPYPVHERALVESGRKVFNLDFSREQAYWYHDASTPKQQAESFDGPQMG